MAIYLFFVVAILLILQRAVHAYLERKNDVRQHPQHDQKPQRPNFVFFFPDTLRAESCGGLYNVKLKPLNLTPQLDTLASKGTTFTQAHAMHTQCAASRCTMLSGLFMHVLGHRTQFHLLQAYEENYFHLLHQNDYHVQWFGKNDVFAPATFNTSVHEWHNTIGYDSGPNAFEFNTSGYYSFLSQGGKDWYNDTRNGDTDAVMKARNFLRSNPPEPFVLFLATRGAHPPYGAPKGFHDTLDLWQMKKAVKLRPTTLENKPKYHAEIRHYRNLTFLSNDTLYLIHKSYLEMIRYTDWTLGVVMEALQSQSHLVKNTAVVVSSDHGDYAGDYGLVEKWPGGADDVLTRVPLLIKLPSTMQPAHNHTVHAPVQLADILETMLDLANITSNHIRFGQSLVSALFGGSGDLERFVYAEGGFAHRSELFPGGSDHLPHNNSNRRQMYWPRAQQEMEQGSPKWVMIRNLTAKLVYRPSRQEISELYDLSKDPQELHNQYNQPSYSLLQQEIMTKLTNWLIETGDVPPQRLDARKMPSCPSPITWDTCQALLEPDPSKDNPVEGKTIESSSS